MRMQEHGHDEGGQTVAGFSLIDAFRQRRSRRFGLGMEIPNGALAYKSRHSPVALTEEEEAALVFAACGVTGHALADLAFGQGHGGNIMGGLAARTIASGDGLQTVSLFVTNDCGTWFVRRPSDMPSVSVQELIELGRRNNFTECYRRSRVKIKNERAVTPSEPLFNIDVNRWSAHARGTSYFLPVNDLTLMYINGLLEILNESTGVFIVDERANFQPAGLSKFARGHGGHLNDDPNKLRLITIRQLEQFVSEFVTAEQGMMLQNLGLMAESMGLGGFPNFANHEFAWFQALGFRMEQMPASQYLGAGWLPSLAMKLFKKNPTIPYPIGLELDGEVLLKPFCPPYFRNMAEAVQAVVELKFGKNGLFRQSERTSAWKHHAETTQQIPGLSEKAIAATVAYCEYVWQRYQRFPAHMPPYRTVLGFQATHLDLEFYDKFYRDEALSDTQRRDFAARQARSAND